MLYTKPKNAEKIRSYNIVVGYYHGKAIVKNESGFLSYIECEECHAPEGTMVENQALSSVEMLPEEEKKMIYSIFEERN